MIPEPTRVETHGRDRAHQYEIRRRRPLLGRSWPTRHELAVRMARRADQ